MFKKIIVGVILLGSFLGFHHSVEAQEVSTQNRNKIHFINVLASGSDAIILESNGHFAMIDTGEDYDFPEEEDGYPLRSGISMNARDVLTERVFRHLNELGVQKLDFILLTHVHSDHIGNADEIIENYPVDRIYMKRYDDSRITDSGRLWDNQYGYSNVLTAAAEKGVPVIQDISEEQAHFTFGDMDIQLYNYENEYIAPGVLKPVWDDNSNSMISVLTVNGKRIFLAGDLDNVHGAEEKYAPLIGKVNMMKLNHHGESSRSNQKVLLNALSPELAVVTNSWDLESQYSQWLISKNVDIIYTRSKTYDATVFAINSDGFTDISREYNPIPAFSPGWHQASNGALRYQDAEDTGNYTIGWKELNQEWYYFNSKGFLIKNQWKNILNKRYYFHDNGVMAISWLKLGEEWYYLDAVNGDMKTGWIYVNNQWYYLSDTGVMKTGWVQDGSTWYYLDTVNGNMKTGWIYNGNKWYYLLSSGAMATGWIKDETNWYYLDSMNGDMKIGWFQVGGKWYYTYGSGALAVNTTINGYRVNYNGEWVQK